MLKFIGNLFRRDKFYPILFVIVLGIYSYVSWVSSRQEEEPKDTTAIQKFEQAEESFSQRMKDPEALKRFFKEDPKLAFAIQATSGIAGTALLSGIVILYLYFGRRKLKMKAVIPPVVDTMDWGGRILSKVILLFLFSSFVLTLILAAFKKWVFPDYTDYFFLLLHTVLSNTAGIGFILYFIKKQGGSLKSLGLQIPSRSFLAELVSGWMGYLAVIPLFVIVLMVISRIFDSLGMKPEPHPLVDLFLDQAGSKPRLVFSLVLAVILSPIMEEIFFRGFCYGVFKKQYGKDVGMVITASLFAVIHGSVFAFWPVFVLGLMLNYLYELRQSIVAPMILHITHNAVFIAFFFLAKEVILRHP